MPDISTTINKDIKGIRIGFDEKYATEGVNEEVAKSVVDSLSVLKDLGAEIVDVKMPDISKYISFWYDIARAESILAHSEFYPNKREDYGFFYRKWLDTGSKITGSEYAHANNMRIECNSLIKTAVEPVDVLLTPTLIAPPHTITPEMLYGPSKLIHNKNFQKFTIPYDFNGTPTLCTPSGFTEDGLPLSIQFVGKHLSEPLLCQIGNAYEKLTGFTSAHPDV